MDFAEAQLCPAEVVPVRIHCEAEDCNALLEVSVNVHQAYENPVIVRCGLCRRLLEVNLSQAVASPQNVNRGTQQSGFYPQGHSSFCWAETVSTGFGKQRGSATLSINRPPVLVPSRDARIQYNSEVLSKERNILNIYNIQKPRPLSRCSAQQLATALKSETSSRPQTANSIGDIRPTLLASLLKTKNKKYKVHKMKKPSAYNIFMRRELKEVIAANPLLDHREAFKIAAGNWMRSPNSCAKHKLSTGSVLKTQLQPPPSIGNGNEREVLSESLEKCLGEPGAVSPMTKESDLRSNSSREGNSCSMIDLLMRKDSVFDAVKER